MYKNFIVKPYYEGDFDKTQKDVEEVMGILDGTGISITVSDATKDYCILELSVDEEKLKRFRTRNAGPGYKVSAKRISKYKIRPTYREVMEMRETMENKEIIAKIGCSESAFYRQLRYRKKQLEEGSQFFTENDYFF